MVIKRITFLGLILLSLLFLLPMRQSSAASCSGPITNGNLLRIQGANRRITAIEISKNTFPSKKSASSVIIARDNDYADATAGAPLARLRNGPLLLSKQNTLDTEVLNEISRVISHDKPIYLLGGASALAPVLEDQLKGIGFSKLGRLDGKNRYETAVKIAEQFPKDTTVQVGLATGANFADALSMGAVAARDKFPVLLTRKTNLPQEVNYFISSRPQIIAVHLAGGTSAISNQVSTTLNNISNINSISRYAGTDRYDTSAKIVTAFYGSLPCTVSFASGIDFADGVIGGAHAGKFNSGLLLTRPNKVPTQIQNFLELNKDAIEGGYIYGGPAAIDNLTGNQAEAMFDPATFLFWGDSGESNTHWDKIAAGIVQRFQTENVDGAFMLGDNLYENGASSASDPKFATIYESPLAAILSKLSLNVILGNHDIRTNNGQGELDYAKSNNYWYMPNRYYSRNIDNIRVVALNSNQSAVTQAQLDFLDNELKNDIDAVHQVVISHHPVYSSGFHGQNNDQPWMKSLVEPIVTADGVEFFLSGHDHDFEAIKDKSGVNYIISGGAARLKPITATSQTLFAVSDYNFSKLEIYYSYADLTVYDENNNELWTNRYSI